MSYSPLLDQLIDAFCCLPGVGPKSAQRMAFYVLERNRAGGSELAKKLEAAIRDIGHCQQCRTLTEFDVCALCRSDRRDRQLLCVVESPADVAAVEKAIAYHGLYYVLMGKLSPLDGIGPKELGLDKLRVRLQSGEVKELILATNPTVEGEATAHYLSEMAREFAVAVTRIAQGVPLGGELEYLDGGTLSHAFSERRKVI